MTLSPDKTDVDYVPGAATSNGYQEYNLYYPDETVFPKPAAGWPCVVWINNTAFTASSRGATIASTRERIVQRGFALCDATVTITDTGDVNITGGGMFYPPSETANWANNDVPEKDVIWIVQKIRDAESADINPAAIGLYGSEWAAATLCNWVAMEPDHINPGASNTQEQKSSLVASCFGVAGTWWNPAMQGSASQSHLRDDGTPSTPASTYADADPDHRLQFSPLYRPYLFPMGGQSTQVYMRATASATAPTDVRLDANGLPARSGTQTSETDGWQQIMGMHWLRRKHKAHVHHSRKSISGTTFASQYRYFDRFDPSSDLVERTVAFFKSTLAGGFEDTVDTWDITLDWDKSMSTRRPAVVDNAVHSARHSTASWYSRSFVTESRRTWQVGSERATSADITRLRAIADTCRYGALPILFPLPSTPGSIAVNFVRGTLEYEHLGHDRWRYQVQVEEAI